MHNVFYMGQIVSDAQPIHFKILEHGYAKDMHHVYQYGRIVEGLNPLNFQAP